MNFLPHTESERQKMLSTIGVERLEDLFRDVPEKIRFPELRLPEPIAEMDLNRLMESLAGHNRMVSDDGFFLGAGVYRHYRPAVVDHVVGRGEFYTAYTPYQPELSQGLLQAMFEYQTMICRLTGMEVSNASHYDGAAALAEAVLLALDVTEGARSEVVLSPAVNPHYRAVVATYLQGTDAAMVCGNGELSDISELSSRLCNKTAAFVIQNPNFFGQFEDVNKLAAKVHEAGALLIVVADPISLGLFSPPGEYGADVVVADGQPLGLPMSFGGPHLGILSTRKRYTRRLAGRLVGQTTDANGKRGYVLTLATREQHIRRAKATSNICTNAALSALAAAAYLATMGKHGLRKVAELCFQKSHYAASQIGGVPGLVINPLAPRTPFFKEFMVKMPMAPSEVNDRLLDQFGIIGGYDLGDQFPTLQNHMLIAVTELNSRASIDRLAGALRCILKDCSDG